MKNNHDLSTWGGQREGAGRPPGSTSERLRELRSLLDPHKSDLVAKAVEMALGGDMQAMKLCIDRIFPIVRTIEEPASIQLEGDSLRDKADSILMMARSGEFSVRDLAGLIQTLSNYARIIDVDDLERRVAALEVR